MAIQDLAIFTSLGVFVVLPSSRFLPPIILLWLYLWLYCSVVLLLWYAVLARVRLGGLFYVSPPCPGVHHHGSRVVAHLQPLCWGFFLSFEVAWSDVRLVSFTCSVSQLSWNGQDGWLPSFGFLQGLVVLCLLDSSDLKVPLRRACLEE